MVAVAVAVAGTSMATAMTMRMQRTAAVVMATTMPGRKNASLQEYGSRGTSGPTVEAAEQFETLPALPDVVPAPIAPKPGDLCLQ